MLYVDRLNNSSKCWTNLMQYNFFGTWFKFQTMFNALYISQVSFLKLIMWNPLIQNWHLGKQRGRSNGLFGNLASSVFKVWHVFLNHLFLPLFWTLSISSCVIYLDDSWVRHFPVIVLLGLNHFLFLLYN